MIKQIILWLGIGAVFSVSMAAWGQTPLQRLVVEPKDPAVQPLVNDGAADRLHGTKWIENMPADHCARAAKLLATHPQVKAVQCLPMGK